MGKELGVVGLDEVASWLTGVAVDGVDTSQQTKAKLKLSKGAD